MIIFSAIRYKSSLISDNVPIRQAVNGSQRLEFSANEKGIENATMTIRDLNQGDRGHYSCLIYLYDTDEPIRNTTTLVRVKGNEEF